MEKNVRKLYFRYQYWYQLIPTGTNGVPGTNALLLVAAEPAPE